MSLKFLITESDGHEPSGNSNPKTRIPYFSKIRSS